MGLGRAMWLFWSWPADTGCTTQQQRPGDQVFLWASRNPDLVTHVCQLSHPGRQPARAMVWLLVPVLSIRLQCPCLFPCLQKMKQLMARERKKQHIKSILITEELTPCLRMWYQVPALTELEKVLHIPGRIWRDVVGRMSHLIGSWPVWEELWSGLRLSSRDCCLSSNGCPDLLSACLEEPAKCP